MLNGWIVGATMKGSGAGFNRIAAIRRSLERAVDRHARAAHRSQAATLVRSRVGRPVASD
jgi:hypothetical protein